MGASQRSRGARRGRAVLVPFVALLVAAPLLPSSSAAAAPEPELASYIVTLDPSSSPERLLRTLGTVGGADVDPVAPFATVPAVVADLSPSAAAAVAALPGVVDVAPNQQLRPLIDQSTVQVGADDAWSVGLTGAGTTVAVLDTGVDAAHPMIAGKVVEEGCFTPARAGGGGHCPNGAVQQIGTGAAIPCTGTLECGHGTHVAGTAAGQGDGHAGVARDASIIAAQVFTSAASPSEGVGTDEATVIRALEWIYSLRGSHRIAAVNLSLGGDPVVTPCSGSAALLTVLGQLDAAGIAVVAAAGNDGATSRLAFPACLPGVVSVGSVTASGTVSGFSNAAPSLSLLAPGQAIEGPWTAPLTYRSMDGTSFAAPHVAGALAVLRAQLPDWSVSELVALLDRTGDVARRPGTNEYLRANTIRLDRAVQAQYHSRVPAPLVAASSPIGSVDVVATAPGGLRVAGWSLDADTVAPSIVHVYVDGVLTSASTASSARPDVADAFPGWGATRGFDLLVPVGAGDHVVCVYGIDAGPAAPNSLLGCRRAAHRGEPFGAVDAVTGTFGGVRVAGWAIDPDTGAPIDVHVYVDRAGGVLLADAPRPDVAAVHPGYGERHGFDRVVAAGPGSHRVCLYAIDGAGGENTTLGCRTVTVPAPSPFGAVDVVRRTSAGVEVAGWAADPDTTTSIDVHVYVDGVLREVDRADDERLDVAAARPPAGPAHGFAAVVPAPADARQVCVYGINVGAGVNALISCRPIA